MKSKLQQEAIGSIGQNIQLLYAAGARDFLVWLPPNPGLTPAIRTLNQINPGVTQLATGLTQMFNGVLSGVLNQFSGLPGITIRRRALTPSTVGIDPSSPWV